MRRRYISLITFWRGSPPLRNPRTVGLLFALSAPIWIFEVGLFYLIGFSFGFHHIYDNLWHLAAAMALVTALANIGSSVPSSPGGIGLFELIARETLMLLATCGGGQVACGGVCYGEPLCAAAADDRARAGVPVVGQSVAAEAGKG